MLSEINQRVYNIANYARDNLVFIGLIGIILFPFYYYIFEYTFPQYYENLNLRMIGVALFIPIALHKFLPDFCKKYFPWYFLFSISYAVTFFCSFMLIKNNFSITWTIINMAALFLFIVIIYDWQIVLSSIIIGFILSYFSVLIIDGSVSFKNFSFEYLTIYLLILFCHAVIRYKNKAADIALLSSLRDLSASIAHEMRGPLGTVNQSIGMIVEQAEKLENTLPKNIHPREIIEIKGLAEMIKISVERGNMAIDMILKNIQEKKIDGSNFKIILMSEVIKMAMKEFAFSSGERNKIIINYANDFHFRGDENLMVFTLFNLIKNSLYYMKTIEDGRIDIWMRNGNNSNTLHFKDNGPGIPKERLPQIFENYKTYGKKGGTGLGLPFCRRTMISFDGKIECLSEVGEWTEFVMAFPRVSEASIAKKNSTITIQEVKDLVNKKTILLVDDDGLIRMVMRARLKDLGVTIIEAQQGKEAIKILEKEQVDLIFMDIQMPEINGIEATKLIRSGANFKQFQNYKNIPIIALTGNAEDDKVLIKGSGMNDYLDKSMTKEELFITLGKWLSNVNKLN